MSIGTLARTPVLKVTLEAPDKPPLVFHVASNGPEITSKFDDVLVSGVAVDATYQSSFFKLKGQMVPAPEAPPDTDASRLARAVLAGDKEAALVLADLVQQEYGTAARPG